MARRKRKSRRKPTKAYSGDEAALLISARIDHTVRQPFGTVNAVKAVNPAQRGRIERVSTQERMVKDSDGRVDTCRAAVVSSLPNALRPLSDAAKEGLESFAALYWDAQPSQAMSYEPRVPGDAEGDGENRAYSRLLSVRRELEAVGGRTGLRVYSRAEEIVSSAHDKPYDGLALQVAEHTGACLSALFARAE